MRTPRPHQSGAIEKLRSSLSSGKRRPLLQIATGGGKTLTAAWIIRSALDKGNRVVFVVPAISLVDQTVREFYAEGIRDVGVIQADHPMTDPTKPVQVASVQTLQRRQLPDAQLVIVDEAHQNFAFVREWMAKPEWAKVPFIGLSATPWAKGLGKTYDDLIIAATTADLIDKGFLSPFKVYAPSRPDLSGVKTVAGDYHQQELSEAMQSGTITADVVTTWLELADRRPTLCFAVDRAHAAGLQKRFLDAGVACAYIDCHTPSEERESIRRAFASGQIEVVCNVGVLTTGVDWDVRCIVLARPTKSEMLYVQIVGRGLRTAEGKDHCLILDHSDTTRSLGFVTDIHYDRLDTGKARVNVTRPKSVPQPKECPTCHYMRPAKVHACPACGFAPERMDAVEVEEGELTILESRRMAKANRSDEWAAKAAFFGELRAHAAVKGYKDGWAANKYKERYGVYPNDPRVKYAAVARYVSPATKAWLQHRQIVWQREQAKARAA